MALPILRAWEIRTPDGVYEIVAHYCFNNEGEGLVLRRHIDDDCAKKTRVVAAYANGFWQSYREVEHYG